MNLILVIASMLYNVFLLRKQMESFELNRKLAYTTSVAEVTDDLRSFKHDFSSIANGIAGFIEHEEWEGLKRFSKDINIELSHVLSKNIANSKLEELPPEIYTLLLAKLSDAEKSGVKFEIAVRGKVEVRDISSVDFCRVLGNLVDNALEAAEESEEKQAALEFTTQMDKLQVLVSNSYNGPVNADSLFQKGYTTKPNHTGIGLAQVNRTIAKYRARGYAFSLVTSCDVLFEQRLTVS